MPPLRARTAIKIWNFAFTCVKSFSNIKTCKLTKTKEEEDKKQEGANTFPQHGQLSICLKVSAAVNAANSLECSDQRWITAIQSKPIIEKTRRIYSLS